jgi:hypothetical protein
MNDTLKPRPRILNRKNKTFAVVHPEDGAY